MTTLSEKFQSGPIEISRSTFERLLRKIRDRIHRETLKHDLARERRQLLEMSDAMLSDLGITHAEAEAEARRRDIPTERAVPRQRIS